MVMQEEVTQPTYQFFNYLCITIKILKVAYLKLIEQTRELPAGAPLTGFTT